MNQLNLLKAYDEQEPKRTLNVLNLLVRALNLPKAYQKLWGLKAELQNLISTI
ncbi:hypothetical protein D8874_01835 [Streptococcus sanguinis]|nr:hypothetical protein D8874_01835 [Streptococcus sanguinis]